MTRRRIFKSPLDRALAHEAVWSQVEGTFSLARRFGNPNFVYVIGEAPDGPVKIGVALDPIIRLRAMQTGNPRRLCLEWVLIGDAAIEKLLHELWKPYAITGEWFRAEIREKLQPIIESAEVNQMTKTLEGQGLSMDDMEQAVRDAHKEHDFVAEGRDSVRHLARGAGYVIENPSRI